MKPAPRQLVTSLLLVATGIALIGCKSPNKSASGSFAAVRIENHTAAQIRAATVVVFQQDGYAFAGGQRSEMVFEKEGSRWDQIASGNWVDEAPVWLRVKASLVSLSTNIFRLECQAYKVRNKGNPFAEDQVRLSSAHRKPYQVLLDQVRAQLSH